jgi:hypothetical protein
MNFIPRPHRRLPVFSRCAAALLLSLAFISYGGNLSSSAVRTQNADISPDVKTIEVENKFGEVKVVAVESGPVGWSWKLETRAKTDALAQADAALVTLAAETNGDHLRLALVLPEKNRDWQLVSDLELHVRKASAIRVRNHFGPVEITGVDGPVDARSESGMIEVHDVQGKLMAQTSFASLKVDGSGPATLKDQSGEIDAAHIHGALEIETSFARLKATDIGGPLNARNQSGSIEAVRVQGKADLKTSFATLEASDIAGPLKARDQSGSITAVRVKGNAELETSFAGLNMEEIEGDAELRNQSGLIKVRKVTGSIQAATSFAAMDIEGSGRTFICHNQSGMITLHAKSSALARIDAQTSFSALDVQLPAGIKPAIRAHTSFADVESDFPVLLKRSGEDPFAGVDPAVPRIALENQSGRIRVQSASE